VRNNCGQEIFRNRGGQAMEPQSFLFYLSSSLSLDRLLQSRSCFKGKEGWKGGTEGGRKEERKEVIKKNLNWFPSNVAVTSCCSAHDGSKSTTTL
jgi:hypothetical protein